MCPFRPPKMALFYTPMHYVLEGECLISTKIYKIWKTIVKRTKVSIFTHVLLLPPYVLQPPPQYHGPNQGKDDLMN